MNSIWGSPWGGLLTSYCIIFMRTCPAPCRRTAGVHVKCACVCWCAQVFVPHYAGHNANQIRHAHIIAFIDQFFANRNHFWCCRFVSFEPGNGPSGITLSYMLAGHWPYCVANDIAKHPDELLRARLQCTDLSQSLVEQDLMELSEGLEGRSTNPVSLLVCRLLNGIACLPYRPYEFLS